MKNRKHMQMLKKSLKVTVNYWAHIFLSIYDYYMIINTKEKTIQAVINNWLISNTQQGNNLCFIPDITWHS